MDLSNFWLKKIKLHAHKLSKVTPHILFLQSCLTLGLVPVGLTIKPALSGMPPFMWNTVEELAHKQSIELTASVLALYTQQQTNHKQSLESLVQLISSKHPNLLDNVLMIIKKSLHKMNFEAENKLKKLSNLCKKQFSNKKSIGLQAPIKQVPLIADKPSLASIFHLPIPTGQKPYLPSHKPVNKHCNSFTNNNTQTKNQVFNISKHQLTEAEKSVLSKGLTYCPTPKFDHFNLIKDVMTLGRNLRLRHFFSHQQPTSSNTNKSNSGLEKFIPPSNWDPPPLPLDHPIEQYINFIVQNIADPSFANSVLNNTQPNLTTEERRAIRTLQSNEDIMVLPADKGSTTVVMDKTDYTNEIERQLSDSNTYVLLKENPTIQFTSELKELIEQHAPHNHVSPDTVRLLVPDTPSTPKIYILPKIHKGVTPPPGRPIVSGCNSPTERISAFVDSHLQPFVQKLSSYVRDSQDFLLKLSALPKPLPKDTILATVDVTSLYTNIPHVHGLSAAEHYLDKRLNGTLPTTHFILSLMKFILEKNNFQFLDKHYLQIKGTAMGTRMAPAYANLFMGRLEENFLARQQQQPICWFRYIDDIFLMWTHGPDSLKNFLSSLNDFSTLNFTWETSNNSINFLDITVQLEEGNIRTSVYTKPTNQQQYLHFNSCHPNNTKRSLPYSLALRGQRLSSDKSSLAEYNKNLQMAFENRGYPSRLVKSQIEAAQKYPPSQNAKNNTDECTNLITTYHPGLQKLNDLLKTGYKILESSNLTRNLLQKSPTLVYRQPPNLRNLLVHPKLPDPSIEPALKLPSGSYPCQEKRCKTCHINPPTETFLDKNHSKEYKIHGHLTCSSENLIYQLQCNPCQAQYIGLTTETLRKRMNGHRHDVRCRKDKPVAIHANSHGLDFDNCFTAKALRSFPKQHCNSSALRRWELAYQHVTNSRVPPNLNLR